MITFYTHNIQETLKLLNLINWNGNFELRIKTCMSQFEETANKMIMVTIQEESESFAKKIPLNSNMQSSQDFEIKSQLRENGFKENLKMLRNCKSLTQDDLTGSINVSTITIRSYESGRREPTGKTLCKLAKFFDVDPEDLMGNSLKDN